MDGPDPGKVKSEPSGHIGMIFGVTHKISYVYSAPVFLEPHILRLRPRSDEYQNVRNFSLSVEPEPAGIHHFLDAEGNNATCLWFVEQTAKLSLATSFEAQTFCKNPFSYLVTDSAFQQLPVVYGSFAARALAPSLTAIEIDETVAAFAKSVFADSKGDTLNFLSRLCLALYENFKVEIRDQGLPLSPVITFQNKSGACRDLVVLYMSICRNFGLATRFVSGYQEGDPDMDRRHLHAWAEVYIPGGGWRGYDPSHGLVIADRHIALAASYDPAGTLPVKGTFRGTGAAATMDYRISLSAVSE
jgi:transglutaminase-like putative cysteine protease